MTRPPRQRSWRLALLSLFVLLVGAPSLASADPTVDVSKDGTVVGSVTVGAPLHEVRSHLSNVEQLRRESKDVTDVDVRREGACEVVTTHASNMIDLTYTARRCPTEAGWMETLLESDGMTDYYVEWFLEPVPEGVHIRFRMRVDLDIPVPNRLIRGATRGNVKRSLDGLLARFGEPSAPPRQVVAGD